MIKTAPSKLPVLSKPLNLPRHHSQCEMNYHLCMSLIPGCRSGEREWQFWMDAGRSTRLVLRLHESAPYTTTLDLIQEVPQRRYMEAPTIRVRLYHDVEMAEVVAWNRHRHWLPVYQYPNRNMYHRDEKLALNRFLGELLVHCRKLGIAHKEVCESIRINKK